MAKRTADNVFVTNVPSANPKIALSGGKICNARIAAVAVPSPSDTIQIFIGVRTSSLAKNTRARTGIVHAKGNEAIIHEKTNAVLCNIVPERSKRILKMSDAKKTPIILVGIVARNIQLSVWRRIIFCAGKLFFCLENFGNAAFANGIPTMERRTCPQLAPMENAPTVPTIKKLAVHTSAD